MRPLRAEREAPRVSAIRRLGAILGSLAVLLAGPGRAAESPAPLTLERVVRLPDVRGRIDHLAVDLARERLLLAELGNGTLDVVDLRAGRAIGRIPGLDEPQGVAFVARSDRIVVADGGDGAVRIFRAGDLSPAGEIELGRDADDVRVDPRSGHVLVGYGGGGLAVIDPVGPAKLADVPLPAHPEGFELDPGSQRIFLNLPDAREIGVVDPGAGRAIAHWSMRDAGANFPMALGPGGAQLAVVFRSPPQLVLLDAKTGTVTRSLETCRDADDVFFDRSRARLYVSCGEGVVDVLASDDAGLHRLQRIATSPGARTSLFVPEMDRLFVAAPARASGAGAAILVLRAAP